MILELAILMFLYIWFFFFISTRNFWKDTDRHANNTWWKISDRFLTVKYVHIYMFNIGFFEQNHSKIGVMSAFWISNNYLHIILCYRRAKSPFGFLIKWCIALQVETLDIVFRQITTFLKDSEVIIPLQKIIDKYIWKTLISWMHDIFDFWEFF